jgi:hypothetical protein
MKLYLHYGKRSLSTVVLTQKIRCNIIPNTKSTAHVQE